MNQMNVNFLSSLQIQEQYLSPGKPGNKQTAVSESFADILNQKAALNNLAGGQNAGVKFSRHAQSRLSDRSIDLSTEQMERLNQGTAKASEKGIKDSLVLIDNLAFIVNVPNNTVITAVDQEQADSNIFTNIDGAVIA